jgi:hypothetical protein
MLRIENKNILIMNEIERFLDCFVGSSPLRAMTLQFRHCEPL